MTSLDAVFLRSGFARCLDFHVPGAAIHVRPINSCRKVNRTAEPFVACRGYLRDQMIAFLRVPPRPIALDHFDTVAGKKRPLASNRHDRAVAAFQLASSKLALLAKPTLLRFPLVVALQFDHLVIGVSDLANGEFDPDCA